MCTEGRGRQAGARDTAGEWGSAGMVGCLGGLLRSLALPLWYFLLPPPPGGQRDRCQQSWFGAGQGQAPEGALILRSYGQSGQDRLASAAHVGGWAQVAPPLPPFRGWTQPTIRGQPSEQSQGFLLPWWGSWGPGEAPQGWRGHPRTSGRGGGGGQSLSLQPPGLLGPQARPSEGACQRHTVPSRAWAWWVVELA